MSEDHSIEIKYGASPCPFKIITNKIAHTIKIEMNPEGVKFIAKHDSGYLVHLSKKVEEQVTKMMHSIVETRNV